MSGSLLACRQHGLEHELLSTGELSARYPAYAPPEGTVARAAARRRLPLGRTLRAGPWRCGPAEGAELRLDERVLDWEGLPGGGVSVRTDRGTYEAGRLVLCPGAWADDLDAASRSRGFSLRRARSWRGSRRTGRPAFDPTSFPVFVIESDGRDHYGFPEVGRPGFKVGRMNHPGGIVDPDALERAGRRATSSRSCGRSWRSGSRPEPAEVLEAVACMFTNTPDRHFLIDIHPAEPDVVIGSACSGHGFKFAPVVGEILADLAIDGLDETRDRVPEAPPLPRRRAP